MAYNLNSSQAESAFNMAFAYLQRIDKILYMCQEASFSQNIQGWCTYLRSLFREVSVKLNTKEQEELEGQEVNINFDEKVTEDEATFKNLYYLLNDSDLRSKHKNTILFLEDKLEIKLRRKLQEKGMLLPGRDDPRFAVTKR